jgi:hypothetical protein
LHEPVSNSLHIHEVCIKIDSRILRPLPIKKSHERNDVDEMVFSKKFAKFGKYKKVVTAIVAECGPSQSLLIYSDKILMML